MLTKVGNRYLIPSRELLPLNKISQNLFHSKSTNPYYQSSQHLYKKAALGGCFIDINITRLHFSLTKNVPEQSILNEYTECSTYHLERFPD